jgi:hypothetical protein
MVSSPFCEIRYFSSHESESDLSGVAWNRWRLGCADLYVEQEVEPRAREGKEEGPALLVLDAELAVKVAAFGLGSGVSSQTR